VLNTRTALARPANRIGPHGPLPEPEAEPDRGWLRRSARDWTADTCFAAAASALGALFILDSRNDVPPVPAPPLAQELVIGGAVCAGLLLLRRRWPLGLVLSLMLAGTVSVAASAAAFVGLLNVAVRRSWRVTAAVAGLHVAWAAVFFQLIDMTPRQYRESVVFTLLLDAALVASGLLVRSQRLLVRSLKDRARQAEEEQRLRLEETRRLERERIAREMHDVLAHRISLLAMHAGALEFRPEAPATEITRAAGVIRRCAFEALEDLREVIGVLRDDSGAMDAERPQPTLADLDELIGDSRRTGMPVTLDTPDRRSRYGTGRHRGHAYRIVQEGLTNARKHAPGAPVQVAVAGTRGTELTVELRNPLPPSTATAEIPWCAPGCR
jgi:signal transduction histidine kinase